MTNETQPIFQHGNEAVFPTTEHGPSLYGILEGAWMLPVLLKGLRTKIWEQEIPDGVKHIDPITTGWLKLGLLEPLFANETDKRVTGFPLTENGKRVVACAGLLEYEFSVMEQQLNGTLETDPVKYAQLRDGLAAYSTNYLGPIYEWLGTLFDGTERKIMDYCGGKGQYLNHLMTQFEHIEGHLVDKRANEATLPEDAYRHNYDITAPLFKEEVVDQWGGEFDLIIMSECLHCVDEKGRAAMIAHAYNLLRLGGTLVILEQFPNLRLDWRLHDLSHGGSVLGMDQVAYEVQYLPFKPATTLQAVSHFGISFTKEAPQDEEA